MSKTHDKRIPCDTIRRLVMGDDVAIHTVIEHFRPYIRKMATKTLYDAYGNSYIGVDKQRQDCLEERLMLAILQYRILGK